MTAIQPRTASNRPGETLAAVRAIRPILMENRMWADEHARMAPAVKKACQDAGLFVLVAPREYGGLEVALPEVCAINEELGYADPSVGWHVGNSMALTRGSCQLEPDAARSMLSGCRGPFGFSGIPGKAVPVDGGYRLSGSWQWLTGAFDVDWAALVALIEPEDGQPPQPALFNVPARDLQVVSTWDGAVAMRGTGSHSIKVDNALVPTALVNRVGGQSRIDRPTFTLPPGVHTGVFGMSFLAVGIARRAIDAATTLVATKLSRTDGIAYRDRPAMQLRLAEAHIAVNAISAGQSAVAEGTWEAAHSGPLPPELRGRIWASAIWTIDQTRRLVSEMATLATSAFYSERNPVEMALRDIHSVAATIEPLRSAQQDYGRVLVGLEPTHPQY